MKTAVLFFLLLIWNVYEIESSELKFVQAVWRHGFRSPSKKPYPNDPHDETAWPRGFNQLTNKGIIQMKELGNFFRERYAGNFTSKKFDYREVYIRSSSADRALTSAQAMLNGFFPPIDDQAWGNGETWQPIPVHADAPQEKDPLLKPTSFDCPMYEKNYDDDTKNYVKELKTKYTGLFKFLGNVTGHGSGITLDNVLKMNNINREVANNLPQPWYVTKVWPEYDHKTTLELITEIYSDSRLREFNHRRLYYLRGGYILGDWLKRAENVVNRKQLDPTKMVLYSAHDGTLLSLTNALQISNQTYPISYAACLIMEIWKNDEGDFEIKLYYRRDGELVQVFVPNCEGICPFKKLYDLRKKDAIFDENLLYRECGLTYCNLGLPLSKSPNSGNIIAINIFLLLVTVVFSIFLK